MVYILGLIAGLVHKGKGCQKSQCLSLAAAPEPSQLEEQSGAGRNTNWEITFLTLPWTRIWAGEQAPKGYFPPPGEGHWLSWAGSPGQKSAAWKWIRVAKEPKRGTSYFSIFVDSLDAISHYASVFHLYIFMEGLQSPAGIHFVFFGWSSLQNLTPLMVRVLKSWGILNGQVLYQGEGTIRNVRLCMQCL